MRYRSSPFFLGHIVISLPELHDWNGATDVLRNEVALILARKLARKTAGVCERNIAS
jgi:hypothetical protein